MDDRKKRIENILKNSQESRVSLDTLLENFGEKLYLKTKEIQSEYEARSGFEDINQYKALLEDIDQSNDSIVKIEEKNRRFKELEEAIETRENEEKERAKEIAIVFRRLGRALFENPAYADYTSFYKEQFDGLKAKLESLEARIIELDSKSGNVFSWIGKSAQGLVLKSFLSKAQDSQGQLFLTIGERYLQRNIQQGARDYVSDDDEVAKVRAEIDILRGDSRVVQDEIAVLKDEKRIISAGFGIDGNPQKQIQSVNNHITQVNNTLRALYKSFGSQAAGIMDAEINPDRKYFIDAIVTAEDGEIIGRAVRLNQSLMDNEKAIIKLQASLAIDEEKAKIEKFQKSIEEKKKRIDDLKKSISDLEENVRESGKYICELEEKL